MKFGVQMYSLREMCATADGTAKAFDEIAKMGAQVAEICYVDNISAKQYAKFAKDSGIEICSSHTSLQRILNDTDKLIDEHLEFGCRIMGIGGAPTRNILSVKKFCAGYTKASETAQKRGVSLAYHNHHHELKKLLFRGKILDEILARTPENVKMCLDIGWVKKGGASAEEYLNNYKDRVAIIHIKDFSVTKKQVVPLGEGDVGIKKVINLADTCGTRYAVIEEESKDNPLARIQQSMLYIKNL